jgi:predicted RND superfamily exporter protein
MGEWLWHEDFPDHSRHYRQSVMRRNRQRSCGFFARSRSARPHVINAIFVNATTTMVGFGSMMIAARRGLDGLGLLLTLGVGTCLLVSVFTVPAVLTWITRHRGARGVEPSRAHPSSALEEVPQTLEFLRIAEFRAGQEPDKDQADRAA